MDDKDLDGEILVRREIRARDWHGWAAIHTKMRPDDSKGVPEHGISLKQFRAHCAEQPRLIGGWLFILEESTGDILFQRLDRLEALGRIGGYSMDPGGMIFWARAAFELFGRLPRPQQEGAPWPTASTEHSRP